MQTIHEISQISVQFIQVLRALNLIIEGQIGVVAHALLGCLLFQLMKRVAKFNKGQIGCVCGFLRGYEKREGRK